MADTLFRTVKGQVLTIPEDVVPTELYNYGPFQQPNNLPTTTRGIPETSPFYGNGTKFNEKTYRLCWRGYEDPTPDWKYPRICDSRAPGAQESFIDGLVWIPQHDHIDNVDNLITWGQRDEETGMREHKALGAKVQDDNTILVDFVEGLDEALNFKFLEESSPRLPGVLEVTLYDISAWRLFNLDGWELDYFYACDHPTKGRTLYLSDPYKRTTNSTLWSTIPCQIVSLQVRYWYEDRRQRRIKPVEERQSDPSNRDEEDPESLPGNEYTYVARNIPRVVTFIDEDGHIEPRWTERELQERRRWEEQGVEYIRPYLLQRRAEEQAMEALLAAGGHPGEMGSLDDGAFDSTLETDAILPSPSLPQPGFRFNRVMEDPGDILAYTESDTSSEVEDGVGERRQEAFDEAALLARTMNAAISLENRVALLELLRAGAQGLPQDGVLEDRILQDLGLEVEPKRGRHARTGEVQGIGPDDRPAASSVQGLVQVSRSSSGSNIASVEQGPDQNQKVGYCKKFFGGLCSALGESLSGALGISPRKNPQGVSEPVARQRMEESFREPIEGAEPTFREPIDYL
ncbi:hypothetical protein TWF694_011528 [Orbilia ellipsospora]|uniref:Uncharacterized protein n=1 Tax=Orbilia ellipsospora TaxID=2528407 RepID=A0AAV9X8F7_9PEZI